MARACFQGHRRPSQQWIADSVESFFWVKFDDAESAETIECWDSAPDYVCDEMSTFSWDHEDRPRCWTIENADEKKVSSMKRRLELEIVDDERFDALFDALEESLETTREDRLALAEDQWEVQWMGPVRCCIRAGLDMAMGRGRGVLGFTVGDLTAMYPDRIPDWITLQFNTDLLQLPEDTGVWL
jgi:hypothetical protein